LTLNSISSVSINLVTAGVSIFLTPFILSHMGDQRYGVWAVLGSLYAYSMVLQLGLYSAINRYIPMHLARAEPDKIREITSTTTAFFLVMGLLLVLFTFTGADRILALFIIPPGLHAPARLAFYTVGLVAALCLSLNSFGAILSGYQRYELMALGRLIAIGLRVGLVVALLGHTEALLCMALIFGATEGLTGLFNLCFAWRLMPSRPLRVEAIRWGVLRETFGYGLNTFLYAVGAVAVAKTGEIVVGAYLSPEHITYYTLALMPPMLLSGLVESSVASVKPAVAEFDSRNDSQRIRELALLSQKYVLLFIVTAMAFFLFLGGDFYNIWLHRPMNQAVTLLPILSAGYLVHAAQFPLFLVLAGRGEHRVFGFLTVVMGAGAVVLELFFCRVMGWGSIGVAIGSSVAMIAVSGVFLPLHAAKRLRIPLMEFLRRSWLPAAYGVGPGILLLGLWKECQPPRNLLELTLIAASTGLVLLVSSWFLAFDQIERGRFSRMAAGAFEKCGRVPLLERMLRLGRL
jgi:O-antigen/teichoic acid export membrane protein